jgi:hypothetical protein
MDDDILCGKCEKHVAEDPHSCPYAESVYHDESPCNCCDDCAHECGMNI